MRISNVTNTAVLEALHVVPTADAVTNAYIRDVVGQKADASQTTVGVTRTIIAYVKGVLAALTTPPADSSATAFVNAVLGNKADTAQHTAGTTLSTVAYVKGILGLHVVPTADAVTDAFVRDVVGRKTDAAQTTVTGTRSIIAYVKGLLGQTVGVVQKDRVVASTTQTSYQTKLDITGHWRLQALALDIDSATTMYVKITMDGGSPVYLRSDTAGDRFTPCTATILDAVAEPGSENCIAACRAQSHISMGSVSLKIEMRSTTAANSNLKIYYSAES